MAHALLRKVPHHGAQGAPVQSGQQTLAEVVAHRLHELRQDDPRPCEGPYKVSEVDGVHLAQALSDELRSRLKEGVISKELSAGTASSFKEGFCPRAALPPLQATKEPKGYVLIVVPGQHTRLELLVLRNCTARQLRNLEAQTLASPCGQGRLQVLDAHFPLGALPRELRHPTARTPACGSLALEFFGAQRPLPSRGRGSLMVPEGFRVHLGMSSAFHPTASQRMWHCIPGPVLLKLRLAAAIAAHGR
mmetsp:Transcript_90940/g.253030  ORF Transcript_90940/g.253030 Transcript_90940/m.253030 type:complete len:248 (+) Transcript_90940:739-1482(+)